MQYREDIIPTAVSKSQFKVRLFDMTNLNFDYGLILSTKEVPQNEQFVLFKNYHKSPIALPRWLWKYDNSNCRSFWRMSIEQDVKLKNVSFAKLHGFLGYSHIDSGFVVGVGGVSRIFGKYVEANVAFPLHSSGHPLQLQLAIDQLSETE